MNSPVIRRPATGEEAYLRTMWRDVFGDTDEYIGLFFSRIYSPDRTLCAEIDGRIASMLFYPRYGLRTNNGSGTAGYICGAATAAQSRGRGYMAALLGAAVSDMAASGDGAAVLIPADAGLYGYYARTGFSAGPVKRVFAARSVSPPAPCHDADADELTSLYRDISPAFGAAVLQTPATLAAAAADCIADGGRVLAFENGYAFAVKRAGRAHIRELAVAPDLVDGAVSAVCAALGTRDALVCCPPPLSSCGRRRRAGMVRYLSDADASGGDIYMSMMLD